MVSGFFTSPYDHERIFSGEAKPVLIASNSSSWVTCLNRSSNAFMRYSRMIPWPSSLPHKRENEPEGRSFEERPSSFVRRKALGPRLAWSISGDDDRVPSRNSSIPLQIDVDRERADF